jgi:hypothetical protein
MRVFVRHFLEFIELLEEEKVDYLVIGGLPFLEHLQCPPHPVITRPWPPKQYHPPSLPEIFSR